jgi:hypothetical protein
VAALATIGGLLGGLCCLTPIVLVMFGLATVSAANSMGNVLYGEYKWAFRIAALVFLGVGLVVYFRRRGVCTLDQARRERNRIVNAALATLVLFAAVYVFWTYVALHYWGIAAGLPWAQWDESWAIPVSAALFAVAVIALVGWPRWRARRLSAEVEPRR